MQTVNTDLELILAMLTPLLEAAAGNLGNNMHFYVLNDKSESSQRLLDPYQEGSMDIQLKKMNGDPIIANIEMPLNTLYIPRKCPNGKDAHISWKYCPWTGVQLAD